MNTSESELMAMFRYGVIAPLICRRFDGKREEAAARAEILGKEVIFPDGMARKVPERTLRLWLARYRQYGLDGLYDGLRKDRKSKGHYRAMSDAVLKRAEELRRELPERSTRTILRLLQEEGTEVGTLCERTLQRHLKRIGAVRSELRKGKKVYQRWEQLYANDLWHGDTAHAVWLPDPTNPNKLKRTKLIVFVDDASRLCPHAEFYFDEKLPSLIDTFSKAILKHGKPRQLLLDNAFIFHSTTLQVMCAELEVELSFCRPRSPQGKGKVERFIRTLKESFVAEANRAGFTDLADLNRAFQGWLEGEYHCRSHSETGSTPRNRWQKDQTKIQAVTPEHLRRALMMRAQRKVQEQTATIHLDGLEYICSKELTGKTVEVRWHVDTVDSIEVWLDGKFEELAYLAERPTSVPRTQADQEEAYPTVDSAKAWMTRLRESSAMPPPAVLPDEFLSITEFTQLIARYLERALAQQELNRLADFWKRIAPLKRFEMEGGLQRAIAVKGTALHVRYYLEHLEQVARRGRK